MKANLLAVVLLICALPALCQSSANVTSPAPGATLGAWFNVAAGAAPCSGQPVASMGYSLDNGGTSVVPGSSLNRPVSAASGPHTLHVKSWGTGGAACNTDVPITVMGGAGSSDVTVLQPASGGKAVSPFTVMAKGTVCDGQPITAFGFSIDNGGIAGTAQGQSASTPVSASLGVHTLHVKSWGSQGAGCSTDLPIDVVPSPVSQLPSNAVAVEAIQTLSNWQAEADAATGASSATASGASRITASPSLSGRSREFDTTTSNYGGERYDVQLGADSAATNFFYDGWVYLNGSATNIANLELDLNQVLANGQTVIYGFQCDYWKQTWDYTANTGSPQAPVDTWFPSSAPCNIQNWAENTWHHVQISYSRDGGGNVTYHSVWLDNAEQDLNVTVPSSFALNWSQTLLTNFQIDSITASQTSSSVFLDNLTIYRW